VADLQMQFRSLIRSPNAKCFRCINSSR